MHFRLVDFVTFSGLEHGVFQLLLYHFKHYVEPNRAINVQPLYFNLYY